MSHLKRFWIVTAVLGLAIAAPISVLGQQPDHLCKDGLKTWTDFANSGSIQAKVNLAGMLLDGVCVSKDPERALDLLEEAAEADDPEALARLGFIYEEGGPIGIDRKLAYKFFKRAYQIYTESGIYKIEKLGIHPALRVADRLDTLENTLSSAEKAEAATLPTRRAKGRMARSNQEPFEVLSWLDKTRQSTPLNVQKPGSTIVIVADDLTLDVSNFLANDSAIPKAVVIVADTVQIPGQVTVDLRAPADLKAKSGNGGSFALHARRIVVTGNTHIDVLQSGQNGRPAGLIRAQNGYQLRQPENGSDAGNFALCADHFDSPWPNPKVEGGKVQAPFITHRNMAGQGASGGCAECDQKMEAIKFDYQKLSAAAAQATGQQESLQIQNRQRELQNEAGALRSLLSLVNPILPSHSGRAGEAEIGKFFGCASPVLDQRMTDEWLGAIYPKVERQLYEAMLSNDRKAIQRELIRAATLPKEASDPAVSDKIRVTLAKIVDIRTSRVSKLVTENVSVPTPTGGQYDVELMVEDQDFLPKLRPDRLLLEPTGSGKVGYIQTQDSDTVELSLQARLTADPWLEAELKRLLAAKGDAYGGLFTRWSLKEGPLPPDVKLMRVTATGDLIDIMLQFDRRVASLAFWRLSSATGMPLTLHWTYSRDAALDGTFSAKLTTQARNVRPLKSGSSALRNPWLEPVTLEYAQLTDGSFRALPQALTLPPNGEISLADMSIVNTPASIPATAIYFSGVQATEIDRLFEIVGQDSLRARFVVNNKLSVVNPTIDRRLLRVEVRKATFAIGGSDPFKAEGPQLSLAPDGAEGSSYTYTFFKPRLGVGQITLEAVAIYESGQIPLTPITTSDTTVVFMDAHLRQ